MDPFLEFPDHAHVAVRVQKLFAWQLHFELNLHLGCALHRSTEPHRQTSNIIFAAGWPPASSLELMEFVVSARFHLLSRKLPLAVGSVA
jgi:hypothetical protein